MTNISISLPFVRKAAILGAVFALLSIVFISQAGASAKDTARDGRLVTVHDRGQERVILTHAQTVGDALKDAHIAVVKEDMVEPSTDEPLVASDYTVNIYRARPVIVIDGAVRQKVMTAAQTPEGIAKAAGILLHDEDTTKLGSSTGTMMADGASVTLAIERATSVQLTLYGTVSTVYTKAVTVGDMLKRKNITLQKDDSLSVPASTPITEGMAIAVWRNGVQTATVEEPIAFPTRQIQDADQPAGYRKVQTPGTKGRKNVTYEITMKNGKEVSRKMIQSVTLEEPKEQIEVIGVKVQLPAGSHEDWMTAAGMSSTNHGYINYIFTRESGWNPAAVNRSGGYYGLGQTSLSKLTSSCGASWASDPVCQIKVFNSYAVGRYGSWQAAYDFWTKNHWW